jgi:hypothetical protein
VRSAEEKRERLESTRAIKSRARNYMSAEVYPTMYSRSSILPSSKHLRYQSGI